MANCIRSSTGVCMQGSCPVSYKLSFMRIMPSHYLRFFAVSAALAGGILAGKAQPITPPAPYGAAPGNYIKTWQAAAPGLDSNSIVTQPVTGAQQVTQYFDGLDDPPQSVKVLGDLLGPRVRQ